MIITILSFISFCCAYLFISILRISGFSKFESSLFSLILPVSAFAVLTTNGVSFFVFPLIGIIVFLAFNRNNIRFEFLKGFEWITPFGFFLFFYLVYFLFSGFFLSYPHEDYLIYERIGYYNYLYGVENTRTFYNVISNDQPRVELYHFFEIWASVLFTKINGLRFLDNFILILCPLIVWISWLGLSELLPNRRPLMIVAILMSIIIFINPYDIFIKLFEISLPISGLGGLLIHLKYLFVLPILIFVLIQLRESKTNYIIFAFISCLYVLVFPIILAGLVLYDFLYNRFDKKDISIPFIFGFCFFGLTIIVNQEPFFPRIDIYHLTDFSLVGKALIFGVIFPAALLVVVLRFGNGSMFQKSIVVFYVFTSLVGVVLWIMYSNNIDANQLYRNVMASLFPLTLFVLLEKYFDSKSFNIFIFVSCCTFLFIFILPNFKSLRLSHEEGEFIQILDNKNRILYIPNNDEVNTVYKFNERFYFKFNKVFYYYPEIHVFNFSTFYLSQEIEDTDVEKWMIRYYRSISPFLQNCKSVFKLESCIPNYVNDWDVDLVIDKRL